MQQLLTKYQRWTNDACRCMLGNLCVAGLGYVFNAAWLLWTFTVGSLIALGMMCAALWIVNDLQRHLASRSIPIEDKPWYRP